MPGLHEFSCKSCNQNQVVNFGDSGPLFECPNCGAGVESLAEMEKRHGFPCESCGAETFEQAGDLCRADWDCPGCDMSRERFNNY